ncbi:MAG: hypothetical protein ACRDHM_05350 [Actinomycetota bacterium]
MAQAQIALETHRAPSGVWLRFAAAVAGIRARREQRRALVKLLSEWDSGIATGARLTAGSSPWAA